MKKTLVALAALSAVSAFAQVTLSGRASMDVSTYSAMDAVDSTKNLAGRTRVADTSSRIIFAANEDLGAGLKAGVYCETGINIDNGSSTGQADSNNANTTAWCSREGRAYFGNNDVEVRLGRQNVWWTQGALNEVGSTYLGADSLTNLINGGVGVYTVRGENMIKLTAGAGTGAFAGSEVYTAPMGVSGNAGTTNSSGEAAQAGAANKAKYGGFKLLYTQGAVVGMVDYQYSTNSAAVTAAAANTVAGGVGGVRGANSFDRKATKVGLGYKYAQDSMVTAQYWQKSRTDVTTPGTALVTPWALAVNTATTGDAKDSGYGIVVKHALGGGLTAHAQYGKTRNLKDGSGVEQADTSAQAYTLGLTKAVSKRTHFYGAYHQISNANKAAYDMTGGNYSSAGSAGVGLGSTVKMFALGMIHNF